MFALCILKALLAHWRRHKPDFSDRRVTWTNVNMVALTVLWKCETIQTTEDLFPLMCSPHWSTACPQTAALMWARIHTHTHTQGQATIDALFPNQHRKNQVYLTTVKRNPRFQTRSLTLWASSFFPWLLCVLWQNAQHHILSIFISSNLWGTENENGWNWNTGLKTESVHFALVLLSWFGIAKIIYFIIIYFNCSIYQYFKVVGAVL